MSLISILSPRPHPPHMAAGDRGQARLTQYKSVNLPAVLGDRGYVARRLSVFGFASGDDARHHAPDGLHDRTSAIPLFSLRGTPRLVSWSNDVSNSTGITAQSCGKEPADLFDMAGLVGWLRQRFPTSTGYHVEAVTGIPAATVENWTARRARPSAEHFSVLICVFGPSLLRATLRRPPDWLDLAVQAQRIIEIDNEILKLTGEKVTLQGKSEG